MYTHVGMWLIECNLWSPVPAFVWSLVRTHFTILTKFTSQFVRACISPDLVSFWSRTARREPGRGTHTLRYHLSIPSVCNDNDSVMYVQTYIYVWFNWKYMTWNYMYVSLNVVVVLFCALRVVWRQPHGFSRQLSRLFLYRNLQSTKHECVFQSLSPALYLLPS